MVQQVQSAEEHDEPSSLLEDARFKIVNTTRSRFNRVQRMQHPAHARLKQYIGGEHRVVRGRPLVLSASELQKHAKEIKAKAALGVIQVTTMDGRYIHHDLLDQKPAVAAAAAAPAMPSPPLPNKPLDSAARDKNIGIGENIPSLPGGLPQAQVTAGNNTTGGIPGPLENEGKIPHADPAAHGGDPAEDEHEDPAGG